MEQLTLWTLFAEDSHARTSAMREKEKASPWAISQVFGFKCLESLISYDQELQSLKMSPQSHAKEEEWISSCHRWPKSGMMLNGLMYVHQMKARHTKEKGSSLLPTPTAHQQRTPYKQGGKSLLCAMLQQNKLLPTPTCNTSKNNPCTPSAWKRKACLNVEASKIYGYNQKTIGKKHRLNPRFVEWMMGFPIGWTELEP